MAKVKKAQFGTSCGWGRGERSYRKPLGEKVRDAMWSMKLKRDEKRMAKEIMKEEEAKKRAKSVAPRKEDIERDFPQGGSAPGLWGEMKGSKETKWNSGMKNGGKMKTKKAQGGKTLKATRITEKPGVPSSRARIDYSVDTSGYAAGKKKFPATREVSSKYGEKKKDISVRRSKVKSLIEKPFSSRVNKPKLKMGGKLAKQAATAIAMKKKGIKPKKSK